MEHGFIQGSINVPGDVSASSFCIEFLFMIYHTFSNTFFFHPVLLHMYVRACMQQSAPTALTIDHQSTQITESLTGSYFTSYSIVLPPHYILDIIYNTIVTL